MKKPLHIDLGRAGRRDQQLTKGGDRDQATTTHVKARDLSPNHLLGHGGPAQPEQLGHLLGAQGQTLIKEPLGASRGVEHINHATTIHTGAWYV